MTRHRMEALALLTVALVLGICPRSSATRMAGRDAIHMDLYEVLRKNVVDGKVNYGRLKRVSGPVLKRYVDNLSEAKLERQPGESKWYEDNVLAFWINAYNACAIAGIIEHYPSVKSVQDIPGFFTRQRWPVAGEKLSLDDIEGKIRSFKDPRVHFVLVCGARSCPPLQPYSMLGYDLQKDLERITRQVVNDPRYVQIIPKTKRLRLTRIMSWYKQDFVSKYGSLEAFLLRYLDEPKRGQLRAGGYTIEFMPYDWSLNDVSKPARPSAR